MLITKSFFLSEQERLQFEEWVLNNKVKMSEEEILKLDDNELMQLVDQCRK